jgi:hypothetical protein
MWRQAREHYLPFYPAIGETAIFNQFIDVNFADHVVMPRSGSVQFSGHFA